MIVTFETAQSRGLQESGLPAVEYLIRQNWAASELPPWSALRSGETVGQVEAKVNHGRWLVECPGEACAGAQLAAESDPRFVCVECASGPYEVVWPDERDDIESALDARPVPNQNWLPGQTVEDLALEELSS